MSENAPSPTSTLGRGRIIYCSDGDYVEDDPSVSMDLVDGASKENNQDEEIVSS